MPWERRWLQSRFPTTQTQNKVGTASSCLGPFSQRPLHTESHAPTCTCKLTGVCNCATPRVTSNRPKKQAHPSVPKVEAHHNVSRPMMAQPAALVVTANSGRNRPVLPRPSPPTQSRASPPRSVNNPTGIPHQRQPVHYSPYERAYEYVHGADVGELARRIDQPSGDQYPLMAPSGPSDGTTYVDFPRNSNNDEFSAFMASWLAGVQPSLPPSDLPPISCDCGPTCSCPGCVIHRGPSAIPQGLESCVNPATCTSCMDCTMLTAVDNNPAMDEFLRRFAAEAPSNESGSTLPGPGPSLYGAEQPSQQPPQPFDPAMWQTYALWSSLQNQLSGPPPPEDATSVCCAGQCKCPPGMCACPSDCCGCCSGCSCPSCDHEDRSMGLGNGKTLTFAVSGERAPCCGGGRRNPGPDYGQQAAGPSTAGPSRTGLDAASFDGRRALDLRGVYEDWNNSSSSVNVPKVSLSRASSSSSKSSSHGSHRSPSHDLASPPAVQYGDGVEAGVLSTLGRLVELGVIGLRLP